MYGCELWSQDESRVNDFCIAWRKGLKRIWSLPYNTYGDGDILHDNGLSGNIPIFDEICERYLHYSCDLIGFFAWNDITGARGTSLFGRNINTCSVRFNFTVSEFLAGIVSLHVVESVCDD